MWNATAVTVKDNLLTAVKIPVAEITAQLAAAPDSVRWFPVKRRRNERFLHKYVQGTDSFILSMIAIIFQQFIPQLRLDIMKNATGKNDIKITLQSVIQQISLKKIYFHITGRRQLLCFMQTLISNIKSRNHIPVAGKKRRRLCLPHSQYRAKSRNEQEASVSLLHNTSPRMRCLNNIPAHDICFRVH